MKYHVLLLVRLNLSLFDTDKKHSVKYLLKKDRKQEDILKKLIVNRKLGLALWDQ